MSILLAIDTCTRRASVALRDRHTLRAEMTWEAQRHESALISARIRELMHACAIQPNDLGAVAVALGPGSFTGVRAGLAIAKGIALVRNVPIIGATAFEILASAQPRSSWPMLVAIEAGRSRAAVCCYEWQDSTLITASEWWIESWQTLLDKIEPPMWVCGELPTEFAEQARRRGFAVAPPAHNLRRAGFLADLAFDRLQHGEVNDPARLAAIYPAEP
ncbi:MAG: tRNA (adenosine(37)-N6)-threonylcarbamoyltransferase complex dimerization subunit type 1 TsaB [Anaerolineae bacterium]|nr:tRNA (adenosine(37)-N6)-threonylcarbamoyltransferase complex dimerization subunit type 1 TsaB [Thermoflexales bacterium]MDW8396799.1 tRNA (adenosine(37)-N6)-threonylcarbamoyltransferase complex dimerization subunit type 1 TsaB [Anaerolineae bacterium]